MEIIRVRNPTLYERNRWLTASDHSVLHILSGGIPEIKKEKGLEKDLALLYSGLRLQPKNIYELMNETGFKYEELTGMLLKLQLMGLVEQPSENYYSKA